MREEILKAKGRLAEAKRNRGERSLEGKGLLILLRETLDPFEPDLTQLRIPEAGANMRRLVAIHAEMRDLDALGNGDG